MLKPVFKTFPAQYSVKQADYMQRRFSYPIYPWEELEPFWDSILIGISKTLIYHRFTPNCYKDHHIWRALFHNSKQLLEALQFADLLSRDRDVTRAIKGFNKQSPGGMKYGNWLEPMFTLTPNWENQLTQFGQFIYNSMSFLRKTGYISTISGELGLEILRPYWLSARESTLKKEWLLRTFEWMHTEAEKKQRLPNFREIAEHWKVPRYSLVDADLTREIVYQMYRIWNVKGIVEILKVKRKHKLITTGDTEKIARQIVKRIT